MHIGLTYVLAPFLILWIPYFHTCAWKRIQIDITFQTDVIWLHVQWWPQLSGGCAVMLYVVHKCKACTGRLSMEAIAENSM